jgi:hypothetical protein
MMILLPTYPRCGSHYLAEYFLQTTGVVLNKTHRPLTNNYDYRVSIIRDPRESITSRLAMQLHHENEKTLDEYLSICKIEYLTFYKYIIEKVEIVFEYKQLKDIDSVVDHICSITGVKRNGSAFTDTIVDRPENGFLKTATTSGYYDVCKDYMKDKDLSELYEIYEEAKQMVPDLNNNFQAESKKSGDEFEAKVLEDLSIRGFTTIERNYQFKEVGVEVDFRAHHKERFEYVEAKGGNAGDKKRPGAQRTDNVKKAIANGALIKTYNDLYYVVYFSARPDEGSYSDNMIKTALKYKIIDEVRYLP